MDIFTKGALWDYWKMGGDEIEVSDDESSDLEEYWSDKEETIEIFKIETDVFDYETPLCLAFNEFNYLLKVDPDLITKEIIGFKTYEDYKDDWIYEWNENVPWVYDKPWLDNGIWKEPKPVKHTFKPFNYKTGCSEWITCIIMEYLVNISKRRAFWSLNEDILKIYYSDYQYVVSIKEDMAYPCLHSPKTTKERRSIRRIHKKSIRRIKDIVCEYSRRYQTWSLLQETPLRRIQSFGYAVNLDNSTSNVLIPLDS
ncbi:hypothetical protein Tco_0532741 [Tanacetum coccineum]